MIQSIKPIRSNEAVLITKRRRITKMGMMDAFNPEDRVQIKISDLYRLMKEGTKAEFILNAVNCEVPYSHIREMVSGKNDELAAYKDTGLTPDKIKDIDTEYQKICKELADLRKQNEELTAVVDAYEQVTHCEEKPEDAPTLTPPTDDEAKGGTTKKEENGLTEVRLWLLKMPGGK
jgi:hypothetical protein